MINITLQNPASRLLIRHGMDKIKEMVVTSGAGLLCKPVVWILILFAVGPFL